MCPIADSNAFRDSARDLTQHQVALNLIQAGLPSSGTERYRWLDLGCGPGQSLSPVSDGLTKEARGCLSYFALDANQDFLREALRQAELLEIGTVDGKVAGLSDFDAVIDGAERFELITLINVAHELSPREFAKVLVASVARLSDSGLLYAVDMERLDEPELGAALWQKEDIARILRRLFTSIGVDYADLQVSRARHSTTTTWSVQINRKLINVSDDGLRTAVERTEQEVLTEMKTLLAARLAVCRKTLRSLTLYGQATAMEEVDTVRTLFEFWSLTYAMDELP